MCCQPRGRRRRRGGRNCRAGQLPRHRHDLIAAATAQARASHTASADCKRAELAAAERELAKTSAATDRYLAAFENGTLDPEDLAPRLSHLKARTAQLHARHNELATQIAAAPTAPPAATLLQIAEHIDDIIRAGTANQRKALIETLVARIKITGPDRIVPVFRIPDHAHPNQDGRRQPPDERNPTSHRRGSRNDQFGGAKGTRTPDPLLAKQVLFQLSYSPRKPQVTRLIRDPSSHRQARRRPSQRPERIAPGHSAGS